MILDFRTDAQVHEDWCRVTEGWRATFEREFAAVVEVDRAQHALAAEVVS